MTSLLSERIIILSYYKNEKILEIKRDQQLHL